ncbi:hypothetical protein RHSIM_Rhsim04G0208700 [Rhododendron simsii]|uniref:Uncharacterized protein n=1 Tax=Rhododendron simsii TaxID=118357 RepID=A0A834GZ65_RHOSS|nr:hypothetical protein RHSIM_Rhsim04G0208700 [Rhododendron simsii]
MRTAYVTRGVFLSAIICKETNLETEPKKRAGPLNYVFGSNVARKKSHRLYGPLLIKAPDSSRAREVFILFSTSFGPSLILQSFSAVYTLYARCFQGIRFSGEEQSCHDRRSLVSPPSNYGEEEEHKQVEAKLAPLWGIKDRVVIMQWESTRKSHKTIAYDLKQNLLAYFPIPNNTWDVDAITFVESLGSPPSHYKEEEEYPPEGEEYPQISLAGVTSKWKRIHGDFRLANS